LCLLFVWTGQWLRNSAAAQSVALHPLTVSIAVVAFAVTAGIASVDFNLRVFAPFAASLTAALAGCVVAMKAATWLSQVVFLARPLALIGRHTLVIFLLHVSLQKVLLGAYPGQLPGAALGVAGILSAAVTIALLLLVSVGIDQVRARLEGTLGAAPSGAR
jgi:fucose 4-O-acetylase-like acetyltransferase